MKKQTTHVKKSKTSKEQIGHWSKKAAKVVSNDILPVIWKVFLYTFVLSFKVLAYPFRAKPPKRSKLACLKCDGHNVKTVKPSMSDQLRPGVALLALGPVGLLAKQKKPLHVCRDCGFSWER